MKTKAGIAGVVVLLFISGAVFFSGPGVPLDTHVALRELPVDLSFYLKEKEGRYVDITPGAEKTVVWHDPLNRGKTGIAVVYLHGFSATRQEVFPLCEIVARELGANLFYTRLRGHGRPAEALKGVTVNDWLADTVEALEIGKRIGDRVVIISTSMGATLASWYVLERDTGSIHGVVMMSPNFWPAAPGARLMTLPWGKQIARAVLGEYRTWQPVNELQAKYWSHRQPSEATVTMMGLVDYVNGLEFRKFTVPLLMMISPSDQVIDISLAHRRYEEIGSRYKKLVEVPASGDPSSHVLAGDILSPGTTKPVADEIIRFVRSLK